MYKNILDFIKYKNLKVCFSKGGEIKSKLVGQTNTKQIIFKDSECSDDTKNIYSFDENMARTFGDHIKVTKEPGKECHAEIISKDEWDNLLIQHGIKDEEVPILTD